MRVVGSYLDLLGFHSTLTSQNEATNSNTRSGVNPPASRSNGTGGVFLVHRFGEKLGEVVFS